MPSLRFFLTTLVGALLAAASAPAAVIPASRLPPPGIWAAAGVPGGIPDTSLWATIDITRWPYSADKTGATSAVSAINAAIAAASAHTRIVCPAGTYKIDGRITMNKSNVVLVGAKDASLVNLPGQTSAGCTTFKLQTNASAGVYLGISSSWSTPTAITGTDIPAGALVLAVASSSGIKAGKMVRIVQDNDQTIPVVSVTASKKLEGQLTMVTAVAGNLVTIYPALAFPLKAALKPTMSCNANIKTGLGIENIYFDSSRSTLPTYAIQLVSTWGGWVRGCGIYRNIQYNVYWALTVQCEFRHNTIWQERKSDGTLNHGPNMAGIKLDSCSSDLIVDNIFYQQFPSVQINGSYNYTNSASAGNVIAYNFSTQAYNSQGYAATDFDDNHGPCTHHDLFEGNAGEKFQHDGYYGAGTYITLLRNRFTGDNPHSANNNRCIDLGRMARLFNVVGNVLGRPGMTFTYKSATEHPAYATRYIFRLGYPNMDNGGYSGTAKPSAGDWWADYPAKAGAAGYQELDLDVATTALIKGNYNSQNAAIPAGEQLAAGDTIPASLFLLLKPGWFGDLAWPAFDPAHPNFSATAIPAGYRYVNGVEAPGVSALVPPSGGVTNILVK